MKSLKLKPIFLPNDDILVKPPPFISTFDDSNIDRSKNYTISSTEQLKTILRGRQLKKQNLQKAQISEEDEDIVKRLSEWKSFESPKSPLRRKFTFKRTSTMNLSNDPKNNSSGNRSTSVTQTVMPIKPISTMDTILNTVQGIVAVERFKKKVVDAEIQHISERNKNYEISIKSKISRLSKDIESIKKYIRENTEKLDRIKREYDEIIKKHEEELVVISMNEAQDLMFGEKNKKKVIKQGEESQYFIKKEKYRQLKQDLHKKFQEDKDRYQHQIDSTKRSLEVSESNRLQCKKELKAHKEEIVLLYCRILKDGKDIRSDGLRWIIKSLWKMGEYIPISAFPKFFDDESAHFLLLMSEKDLELEKFTKSLDDLRKEIKNKRASVTISNARDLYKTVRSRLRTISQSSIGELLDGTKMIEVDTNLNESLDLKENNANHHEIKDIREKINQINEFIKEIMTQEIKRVTDLYQNNPGEAENVGIFHVIKCLVGDKVREFNKYTRSSNNKQKNRISFV